MKIRANRQPYVYLRLSREDVSDATEPVQIKLEKRKQIALGLVAQHNLVVPEENILLEVVSGKTIEHRVQFKRLLEMAHAGMVSHIITPYIDRLLRGSKRDEADVEEALKDGEVIVISTEGVLDFGDPNFDVSQGLVFSIRNAISRQYIYDLSKKLRETNLVRTKHGQRSAGFAPYGYEWVKPVYRNKQLVTPGHYEVVPEEYMVLEEICRRIWDEGARTIAGLLNQRYTTLGHPRPPSEHNKLGWNGSSIFAIVKNPFYCGYPAHRFANRRNRIRKLHRSEWVLSDEAQTYQCPFTLDEWERLQLTLSERQLKGSPRVDKQSILTGILFCSQGRNMVNKVNFYACSCREYATKHKGMAVHEPKINQVGYDLVRQTIHALPVNLLSRTNRVVDRHEIDRQFSIAQESLMEVRQLRDDLMLHAPTHIRIYGESAFEEVCNRNREKLDFLQAEVERLQILRKLPDVAAIEPLLVSVRKIGFEQFWIEANVHEKRMIISSVLRRIDLVEPVTRYIEAVVITPHEWVSGFIQLPDQVVVPRVSRRK